MGYIYSLSDPITNEIRYIGQTITTLSNRYNHHIYNWKRCHGKMTHVNAWIKSLASVNKKPIITVIAEELDNTKLDDLEIYYIDFYKNKNCNLCNHSLGGKGIKGYKMNKESISKRLKSLKTSVLWKEKHIRHSQIMKKLHENNNINFGYGHLPESIRKKIGNNHSKTMKEMFATTPERFINLRNSVKKPVCSLKENGEIDLIFESAASAGRFYNINNTHITRVCKNKAYKTHDIRFRYYTEQE